MAPAYIGGFKIGCTVFSNENKGIYYNICFNRSVLLYFEGKLLSISPCISSWSVFMLHGNITV